MFREVPRQHANSHKGEFDELNWLVVLNNFARFDKMPHGRPGNSCANSLRNAGAIRRENHEATWPLRGIIMTFPAV